MRHLRTTLPAVLALWAAGCTSDLRAPSNYLVGDDVASDETAGGALQVDCGQLPQAAVGATVRHAVMASGGDANFTFALADDAPAGLSIDTNTGEISGVPEVDGDGVTFDVRVTDGTGAMGSDTCTVDINPRLAVDLQVAAPGCLSGSQSLRDVIVPGTGDGTEILCDGPGGRGNGRMPDGHSVGEGTCQIEGTFQDIRFGTWVVMMRGRQSDAEVWVPYCITNDDPGAFYDVVVSHSGVDDNTLVPLIGTFNPDASFATAMPGDPHFVIQDADSCGASTCSFGFNYSVTSNHFNDSDLNALVTGDTLYRDDMNRPVGMEHDLVRLMGSNIAEDFRARPWVMSLALDYCLSADSADCTGDAIQDNAGARFHFSVLMFPDPA